MCNIEVFPLLALDVNQIYHETPSGKSNREVLIRAARAPIEIDEMLALVLRSSTDQGRRGILLIVTSISSPR